MTDSRLAPPFPVLCFGYHPWSPMWKRNQSLMAALARRPAIERIVFVNPEVALITSPRRLAADLHSLRRYSWRGVWPHHPLAGVEVMTPIHLVPFRGRSATLGRLDRSLIASSLRRFRDRPFLLFVNGVREETDELIALVDKEAAFQVFDWSDDFAQFPRDPTAKRAMQSLTEERVRQADLVLAVNDLLASRARGMGARVEVVPNATGLAAIAEEVEDTAHQGNELLELRSRLRRPVLGYCGFINEHRVDLDLVVDLAGRHPDWTILFLGVVQLDFDRRFPELPNVLFHPAVPHRELAAYLALFDVCLIPHRLNAHTAGNNPLKIYDYLTTGRPIVSTAIAGVEEFRDVIQVVEPAGFVAAVESAVESRMSGADAEAAAARRARATAHTWAARARQVEEILVRAISLSGEE